METLGSLFDKLTIGKIREYKNITLASKLGFPVGLAKKAKKIYLTNKAIEEELVRLISDPSKEMFLMVPEQNKSYLSESATSGLPDDIGKAVSALFTENITLWELEDRRRDTSLQDTERLKAADAVAVHNRARNDLIDKINYLFHNLHVTEKQSIV